MASWRKRSDSGPDPNLGAPTDQLTQQSPSEASFAALCGVSPVEASSGKTRRRRLNRGGDRRANSALYHIALTRARGDQRTRDYLDRRTTHGMTRREATRCIKRYIAREVYGLIRQLNLEEQTLRKA